MENKIPLRPLVPALVTAAVGVLAMLVQAMPSPVWLRVAVIVPLVGFIPGYAVMNAMFPASPSLKAELKGILAVLLSLCIVPAVATVLNSTPWGIRPIPMILSLTILSFGAAAIGWWRGQRTCRQDQTTGRDGQSLFVHLRPAKSGVQWAGIGLFLAVLATGVYWTLLAPPVARPFTEFYTAPETVATLSQPGQTPVIIPLTVVNRENRDLDYRVEVVVDGSPNQVVGPVQLKDKGQWETTFAVSRGANADRRVELNLFRQGDSAPYRAVHLWIGPLQAP